MLEHGGHQLRLYRCTVVESAEGTQCILIPYPCKMEQLTKHSQSISCNRRAPMVMTMKGTMKATMEEMLLEAMRLMLMTMNILMKTILQVDGISIPDWA